MLLNIIKNKLYNIGSLCSYVMNHQELLDDLNSKFDNNSKLTIPQKLWCYYNDNFNIQYCECGKMKKWIGFKHGWRKTCGNIECINNNRKKTNIIKYGVDNPLKSSTIRIKIKKTLIKKYNVDHPMKSEEIKIKYKKTCQLNHGVDSPMKSSQIKNKCKKTWFNKTIDEKESLRKKKKESWDKIPTYKKIEIDNNRKRTNIDKYGTEYVINHIETLNKIKNTLNIRYNVKNSPFENKKIREKSSITYKTNKIKELTIFLNKHDCYYIKHNNINNNLTYRLLCKRTNTEFNISYTNLRLRLMGNMEISPFFYKKHGQSYMETELFEFIEKNYNGDIILNSKSIISPYELDIYLPDLKIAFEFNGLYWHNELHKENNYHLNKTELCENNNIQLVHIYEDDWIYKQDIIKSMILNKIGKSLYKIYGRKTEIRKLVDNKLVRDFLEKNHRQGFVGSSIKLGLFYENELVSLMTFGKRRISLGYKKSIDNDYELLRFCSKLNTNVIGGANKLFKYFIRNYEFNEITTYVDRSWSNGNLYKKLGFDYIDKTKPNYYYIVDGIRHYRFNFRKDILVKEGYPIDKTEHQIMLDRKIYRIYDSGNLKFIMN